MADAGAIGLYRDAVAHMLIDVWASQNIQTSPVSQIKKGYLIHLRTIPLWDWRGSGEYNLSLAVNGMLEGYVIAPNGSPLPYQWVRLYVPETGLLAYQVKTDINGYYKFTLLNPDHRYIVMAVLSSLEAESQVMVLGQVQAAAT